MDDLVGDDEPLNYSPPTTTKKQRTAKVSTQLATPQPASVAQWVSLLEPIEMARAK